MQLTTTTVALGGRTIAIVHPPDAAGLVDEAAFEHEEFLPYWAELWPSAIALARRVDAAPPAGRRIVELGCGLAVPSIAAALAGAEVLATDWAPDALVFAQRNAVENGARLETLRAPWGDAAALLTRAPFDLVLAADVLYERRNVDQLAALLPRLAPEVLLADPGRPALPAFLERVEERWHVTVEPADELPRGAIYRLLRRVP